MKALPLHPVRRLVGVLVVALAVYGVTVPSPAGAATSPTTADPATTAVKDRSAPCTTSGCPTSDIMRPTFAPVGAEETAAVDGLERMATDRVALLHDLDKNDPRLRQWAQPETRGIMLTLLQQAIATAPADRTATERGLVSWFTRVVQQYQIQAADNAQREFELWKTQQCNYRPFFDQVPAYSPGVGCSMLNENGLADNPAALAKGARQPTFEEFVRFGAQDAAYDLGQAQNDSADSLARTAAGVAAAGGILGLAAAGGALGLKGIQAGLLFAPTGEVVKDLTRGTSQKIADFVARLAGGAGEAGLALALAGVMVVLAIVAIALTIASVVIELQLPGKLTKLRQEAGNTPDLSALANATDGSGANLLGALFIGQTGLTSTATYPTSPIAGPPSWHGDRMISRLSNQTPASNVTSKAIRLKTWDDPYGASAITVLGDAGMVEVSHDAGAKWTTETEFRYLDWSGQQKRALLYGDNFIVLDPDGVASANNAGTSCETAGSCSLVNTLQAKDADGQNIVLDLKPEVPTAAQIDTSGALKAGSLVTLSNPNTSPNGDPVTYSWKIESRQKKPSLIGTVIGPGYDADGNFTGPDTAFHGNPTEEKTGQSVTFRFPAKGTFHVRTTAKNAYGISRTTEKDITVGAGDAPSITMARSNLKVLRSGSVGQIEGCLNTTAGEYGLQKLTVDWGDGKTDVGEPKTYLAGAPSTDKVLINTGGVAGYCDASRSFVATHSYAGLDSTDTSYDASLSLDDGEGGSATLTSAQSSLLHVHVVPENVRAYRMLWDADDGVTYNSGDLATLSLDFTGPPSSYGDAMSIDWGDGKSSPGGQFTHVCALCPPPPVGEPITLPPSGCTDPADTTCTHVVAKHRYYAKPGAGGEESVYYPTVNIYDDGELVSSTTVSPTNIPGAPVRIRTVAPELETTFDTSPIAQGGTKTLSGRVRTVDPTSPVVVTVSYDLNDDGPYTSTVTVPPGSGWRDFTISNDFRHRGRNAFRIKVTDASGGTTRHDELFNVTNAPPAPVVDPILATIGDTVEFRVATNDPGSDSYKVTTDWGDGTTDEREFGSEEAGNSVIGSTQHRYLSYPDPSQVSVSVYDGTDTVTVHPQVTILDKPPALTLQAATGNEDQPTTLHGHITDLTASESFTGTVEWGDGSAVQNFTKPAGTTDFTIAHTYTTGAVYPVRVQVTDSGGAASDKVLTNATVTGAPDFSANLPPSGIKGTPFSYIFGARGFPEPTFALAGGALPPGLTLTSGGVLSGTPTTTGSFQFKVKASNSQGSQTTGFIPLQIQAAPVLTASSPPVTGKPGTTYGPYTFTATGTPAPTFSIGSGALPVGLTLTPAGKLSGTPSMPSTSTFTVRATNALGHAETLPITIVVTQKVTVKAPTATIAYGVPVPSSFVPTYTGYVSGAGPTTAPSCPSTAHTGSLPGSYPITCSGGNAGPNYVFAFGPAGKLTIVKAPLVITGSPFAVTAAAKAGKGAFVAQVKNGATGLPAAGIAVTFRIQSTTSLTYGCTATSDATGKASCSTGNGLLLLTYPRGTYTIKAPATTGYLAVSTTGALTK